MSTNTCPYKVAAMPPSDYDQTECDYNRCGHWLQDGEYGSCSHVAAASALRKIAGSIEFIGGILLSMALEDKVEIPKEPCDAYRDDLPRDEARRRENEDAADREQWSDGLEQVRG